MTIALTCGTLVLSSDEAGHAAQSQTAPVVQDKFAGATLKANVSFLITG